MTIQAFHDQDAKDLVEGTRVAPRFQRIQAAALRKLTQLNTAASLNDLRAPAGNSLEALKRDRSGQHSIRDNDQYRVCFVWTELGPTRVEIVDYHQKLRARLLSSITETAMTRIISPVHPGELLREDFLAPAGITNYRLAKSIGVPATRIHEITAERRGVTADTDLRLCRFFGLSEGYWLRVQAHYDIEMAKMSISEELAKIVPWQQAA